MASKKTPKTKKTQKLDELSGQADPRAALDSALLLRGAQPVLKALAADLLERARVSPAVTATLSARHAAEQAQDRTADPYEVWLRFFTKQVAAAWFLSCVFVRVLEDRGLVNQHRIAGPGAMDSQQLFFELAPSLSARDYLLMVFRELSGLPGAADLFDAKHNPVWLLAPSAECAEQLLQLFRTPNASEPALRFGQADTRFLGDLYQDLDEDVRERFALLQTPHFVESFILDRTLERAIERFGLDDTTLIDPTCGSGHFLLGAFERLLDHRLRAEPGLDVRAAAHKALDAVYGADINPYAIAIARFRLTLAFLEKGGYRRLEDAPKLALHLAVADSLLHNPQRKLAYQRSTEDATQTSFGEQRLEERGVWERSSLYELEDPAAVRDVLYREHAAVVGNPPYITPKDAKLRELYRGIYSSAVEQYHLSAPCIERFFCLARERGHVGLITDNAFMKREYGRALIEKVLPYINIQLIVNTAGAFIPGHGTPTLLLFGTAEPEVGGDVHAVLPKRGEPSTPADPARGLVWSSIADHWREPGFENEYISVSLVDRPWLRRHPWILAGGGAIELFKLLESRSKTTLGGMVAAIGRTTVAGEDDLWLAEPGGWRRFGLEASAIPLVIGEAVRDWSIDNATEILYPYKQIGGEAVDGGHPLVRVLWPWRTLLWNRRVFGKQMKAVGRRFYEHLEHYTDKLRTPLSIAFAFVATHNHFVLDRGGKVFNRSAPIIKLPESATEDDLLALLAYLNSSTACFWMKQVFQPKHSAEHKTHPEPERDRYEHAGTQLEQLPVPEGIQGNTHLIAAARQMLELGLQRAGLIATEQIKAAVQHDGLEQQIETLWTRSDVLRERMVALQELIDWEVYRAFKLCNLSRPDVDMDVVSCPRGDRPSERAQARRSFVRKRDQLVPIAEAEVPPVGSLSPNLAVMWADAVAEISSSGELQLLETPLFKRQWRDTDENIEEPLHRKAQERRVVVELVLEELEACVRDSLQPNRINHWVRASNSTSLTVSLSFLGADTSDGIRELIDSQSSPYLSAFRYTDSGLDKRAAWEQTWELQRREDAGEEVGTIPVPPKYDQKDFREATYWSLRGKLDVPKERFISYPGCESDEDGEPVYGWAGWNHLQQAQALAALFQARKQEGWDAARLTPMLAGLLELLPWLKQWHNEPSADFEGLKLGDYFEGYLDEQCAELGLTRDGLRAWRPAAKTRGGGASKGKTKARKAKSDKAAEAN